MNHTPIPQEKTPNPDLLSASYRMALAKEEALRRGGVIAADSAGCRSLERIDEHTMRMRALGAAVGVVQGQGGSDRRVVVHFTLDMGKAVQLQLSPALGEALGKDLIGKSLTGGAR